MKNLILTGVAIAAFFQHAQAQSNWSIGLRTGAELSKTYNLSGQFSRETGIVFHEQVFFTKRVFKNTEVEFNADYKSNVSSSEFVNQVWDGPEYWTTSNSYHSVDIGLAVRYFVFKKNGWETYAMAGLNATRRFTTSNTLIKEWYEDQPRLLQNKSTENNIPSEFFFGAGFNKSISEHWKLNAQVSMMFSTSNAGYYTYYVFNDFSPKVQMGISYCW